MRIRSFAVASLVMAMSSSSGAETLFVIDSEPRDPVGNADGIAGTFVPADGPFSATRNAREGVSVTFNGPDDNWYLDFSAAGEVPLAVGLYDDAIGYDDVSAADNGLEIARGGITCDGLEGRFEVLEVAYGAGNEITSFAADFVQRCLFNSRRLSGAIRFNSNDLLPDVTDDDGDGAIDIADNCPGIPNANQNDADLDYAGDLCDPSQDATFVLIDSAPGTIGGGVRTHLNASDTAFRVVVEFGEVVRIDVDTATDDFGLHFSAAGGTPPTPGLYENATRYPFNEPTEPGLAVSGNGAGCNELTGTFEVFEAEYGPQGEVIRFSADFEQFCGADTEPTRGMVRWHAPFRPAPPLDIDGDGWLTADDNCPGVPNPAQFDTDGDGRGDFCGLEPTAQKCVNDFNKSTAAVVKAQGASSLACIKNFQKGATDKLGAPATAQDCLANDVGGKVAKSTAKLAAKDAASCAGGSDFGHTTAAIAGETGVQAQRDLVADLFGATLDTALVSAAADKVGAKCREEVAKRTQAAVDALWKLTLKQKKAMLLGKKVLAPANGEALADGLVAFFDADAKGVVSKPFNALDAAAGKKCTAVANLATAFPGCAPADLAALGACAERSARCRFCQVLVAADGLTTLDCDLFDNATADASCQQTP